MMSCFQSDSLVMLKSSLMDQVEGKQKNIQAEGRNRRVLADIGNLVKAVDAAKAKNQIKTTRPMTSWCIHNINGSIVDPFQADSKEGYDLFQEASFKQRRHLGTQIYLMAFEELGITIGEEKIKGWKLWPYSRNMKECWTGSSKEWCLCF